MRIIAGLYKGRQLVAPPGRAVRPTSDRLRETLFNVLRDEMAGARVMDGFAGTGALGLEALSRGAAHVTFVERDAGVQQVLRRNIATCGVETQAVVLAEDVLRLVLRRPTLGPFELVLLDPPYDIDALDAVVAAGASLLAADGLMVLEHSRRRTPPERVAGPPGVALRRTLRAGDSVLSFYGPSGTTGQ